jgi:hypothetical protein
MVPTKAVIDVTNNLLEVSCPNGTDLCKAQAIYDFIRKNFEYKARTHENPYIQTPLQTLLDGSGDSLELGVLLASMNRAAGFDSKIYRSPYHTFVEIKVGEINITMDPTCQGCRFMSARVALKGDEQVFS